MSLFPTLHPQKECDLNAGKFFFFYIFERFIFPIPNDSFSLNCEIHTILVLSK